MLRTLTLVLFLRLFSATVSSEIMSYARVSKNGQQARNPYNSWINRLSGRNNTNVENENRNINDIVITVSPVYVSPKTSRLKKGEAVDHPIAPIIIPKYSTLDHEMITKLDTAASKKQIQQRFHPPAIFEHSVAHTNERPQKGNMENSPSMNSSNYPDPIFSGMYEYNPSDFVDDEPPASVITKYSPMPTDTYDKIPDSYKPAPSKDHDSNEHEANYPNFDFASSYGNDETKPIKYSNHDHPPSPVEIPYEHHDHHDLHHDIIYDHIPEYYVHHPKTTTEEPEMNDQRLDKRPYSYYFIGKKLWYIPLYFSIYFVIYIAALVLKSIARHKINFPAHLAETVAQQKRSEPSEGWWNFAERILEGAERFSKIYNKGSSINIR